jgi:hypothetical protein
VGACTKLSDPTGSHAVGHRIHLVAVALTAACSRWPAAQLPVCVSEVRAPNARSLGPSFDAWSVVRADRILSAMNRPRGTAEAVSRMRTRSAQHGRCSSRMPDFRLRDCLQSPYEYQVKPDLLRSLWFVLVRHKNSVPHIRRTFDAPKINSDRCPSHLNLARSSHDWHIISVSSIQSRGATVHSLHELLTTPTRL